jgi:MFS family permease
MTLSFRRSSAGAAPTVPMPRQIWALAVVAFFVALGFGAVGPAIPLLADEFGVGKAIASTAISVFALCRLLSAFANGRLVEKLGEGRVLAFGLGMQAVTTILSGASPNFTLVIVFRSVGGFGSAAFTVASLSLLLRLAPPSHRGRAASIYQGGFLLGAIAGPAIGGFLAEISPRVPFFVYGVTLAVAGTVGMVMLRGTGPSSSLPLPEVDAGSDSPLAVAPDDALETVVAEAVQTAPRRPAAVSTLAQAFRSRPFLACLVINLGVGWMLYGVRNSLMPVYVVEQLRHSPAWAGVAFLISSAVQATTLLFSGRVVDRSGRKPVMVTGAVITTGSVVLLVLPPSSGFFLISMAFFGVGGALLAGAPAAALADITGGRGGRVVAVFQMSADLGGVVGPLVAGVLTDAISYQAAFASGAVVLGLGLVAALVAPETRRPTPEPNLPRSVPAPAMACEHRCEP